MTRKIVLYIAMSLDGYIAAKDDNLEWLFKTEGDGDNGYAEFYDTIDAIILGRRTYDWILDHEGDNFPYKNKQCYVFSKTKQGKDKNVEYINVNITEFVKNLKQTDGKDIWIVGGGELLHDFIEQGLVDEWIITIAPTIIGDGIPLFKKLDFETRLVLKGIRRVNQFTELHYEST
ncbi:dihydrofolate reductase family protein [Anaerocolumna sp. MB42-C2]|uniref:dihydrofolate reductase family protein n=1 Tax=Anaerocolumna sp. MB42-C2 TaxID=3070997 RepID=UPI0027E1A94A|nr:dihydrofolate reductase family protein [Anaerocolumna sp. MB42-C2]WMJ87547.1 dihydrofolate reductase family protein [Anaerocolumna sp. MB42-C2]